MALDVDRLQVGLANYRQCLERQRAQLENEFREMENLFHALFSVYGGNSAEEFQRDWARTSEWFQKYIASTAALSRHLEERTENLRHL